MEKDCRDCIRCRTYYVNEYCTLPSCDYREKGNSLVIEIREKEICDKYEPCEDRCFTEEV